MVWGMCQVHSYCLMYIQDRREGFATFLEERLQAHTYSVSELNVPPWDKTPTAALCLCPCHAIWYKCVTFLCLPAVTKDMLPIYSLIQCFCVYRKTGRIIKACHNLPKCLGPQICNLFLSSHIIIWQLKKKINLLQSGGVPVKYISLQVWY